MSTQIDTLSLVQLRCFISVIDAGSFAGAARRLAMTTSGVSKTISRLEAAYGTRLLHRSTHSVSPTEVGEQVMKAARAVLDGILEIDSLLTYASARGITGSVRISASPAFARRCIVPLLPALNEQHPDIIVDLRASDATLDLAAVGLDLAIRSGHLDGLPGHVRLPWFEFEWVACASPGYLRRHGMPSTPPELAKHNLIGFRNTRTGLVEHWRLRADAFPSSPTWHFVSDDAESALLAAINDLGIMWGPWWLVANSLRSSLITEVLPDWRGDKMPMSILRRGQNLLPARVRAVIEFLHRQGTSFGSVE